MCLFALPAVEVRLTTVRALLIAYNGKQLGDPAKGVEVVIDVVHGEGAAAGKSFPPTLALGSDCYATIKEESEQTLARTEAWHAVSKSTDFYLIKFLWARTHSFYSINLKTCILLPEKTTKFSLSIYISSSSFAALPLIVL